MQILVIGAGVSGLSSGICLLETGFAVHLITREMPEQTTSAVAGAVWHALSTVSDPQLQGWAEVTGQRFRQLTRDSASGVTILSICEAIPGRIGEATWQLLLAEWRTLYPGLKPVASTALPSGYTRGVAYDTYLVETPIYMAFLLERFRQLGGTLETGDISDLASILQPDRLVVNCTGVGARELANDPHVYPIRGQVVRLRPQPQQETGFQVYGGPLDFTYIFPRGQDCILGGTHESGSWSREPDPALSELIRTRCEQISPGLAGAAVIDTRAGLRPGRYQVRLELEDRPGGTVIHNYGHGGIGFTLSWGCAAEVVMLAQAQQR